MKRGKAPEITKDLYSEIGKSYTCERRGISKPRMFKRDSNSSLKNLKYFQGKSSMQGPKTTVMQVSRK